MVSIGNQYKYLDWTIKSINVKIDTFYILHYDSFYQYDHSGLSNVINIDLEQYEYNVNKCYNNIRHHSKKWIIWDSTFFFNQLVTPQFKTLLNDIGSTFNAIYVYGVNLCLDINCNRNNDIFSCKNGGCFMVSNNVELDEKFYNFTIKKETCKKIKYELEDYNNYYFFNFAEAVHEDLILIKYFKDEYVKFMYTNKAFLSFSHFYYNKTKYHIDNGAMHLLNLHLKVAKPHTYTLPANINDIYFYKLENGCRSKIFSGTQYNDYSITIITLVRNNKQYLKESMGSLIKQTSSNWNCIIINDGSDYDVEYRDFLTKENVLHERHFKIINLKEWNGLVKCHKLGMLHVTTDIVGILDADDVLDKCAIEKVLSIYNGTKKDNIFVYTNFFVCNENMHKQSLGYCNEIKTCLLSDRCGNHFKTFKTKYYYLTSGFDDDLQFGGEDQDILFKMEVVARPIFLNEPLYLYRVPTNNNSTVTSMKAITVYSLFISLFKNIYDRYHNLNFTLIFSTAKSKLKSYHKHIRNLSTTNNNEYYGEIFSNNIFIIDASKVIGIDKYLNQFILTQKSSFDVKLDWNYYESKFEFTENVSLEINKFSKIHPSVYFNHVYILNLTQDFAKKERMQKLFDDFGIKVEFVEAIYGKNEPYLSEFKNKYSTELKSPGAYGYSLTMLKIFNDALEKKYKKIMVCDDDIIFHKDFLKEFDKSIRSIPFDWKVLFFGLSGPWSGVNVNQDIKTFNFNKLFLTNVENCDGSYCMGYDITIIPKLIEIASKFNAPFDTAIIKYFNDEHVRNIYAFYPYLALADTTTSQIQFRESDTFDNFSANQFKFRQNMARYNLNSMQNKNYEKFYNDPYPKVSLIALIDKEGLKTNLMLNSFLEQTYCNLELIIIVDAKINYSHYSYLNELSSNPNIIIIKNLTIGSDYIKVAIERASGSIVGFISCENHMLTEFVSKQIKKMNETDCSMIGSNIIYTHLDLLNIVKNDDQNLNRAYQLIKTNNKKGYCVQFGLSTVFFKKYLFKINIWKSIEHVLNQTFDTIPEMLSFLQNESTDTYCLLNEILTITQGNENLLVIDKKFESGHNGLDTAYKNQSNLGRIMKLKHVAK